MQTQWVDAWADGRKPPPGRTAGQRSVVLPVSQFVCEIFLGPGDQSLGNNSIFLPTLLSPRLGRRMGSADHQSARRLWTNQANLAMTLQWTSWG